MDRGRAAQPTTTQVEVLLEHLERHPDLAKGFAKVPRAREACRRSWEVLTLRLNSLGGCVKSWQQWNKYWADKKNTVKKKAVLRHRALHGTGGGDRVVELTEIEERILALMGGEQFATGNAELRTSLLTTATGPNSPPPNLDTLPPSPPSVQARQLAPLPSTSTESPSLLVFGMDIWSPPPPPPAQFQDAPAGPNSQSTPSLDDDTTRILPVVSTPPRAAASLSQQISPSASGAHPPQTPQPRQQRNVRRRLATPRGRFSQIPTPSRRRRQLSPPSQRPTQYSRVSERFLSLEEGRIELDRQRIEVDRQRIEADRERIQAYREAEHARTQAYRERTEVDRQRLDFERQYAREKMEVERRKSSYARRAEYDS